MPPRRTRRRARRRSSARPIIVLVAAVVVLAILVGGLTQVSRQSEGYRTTSDRALAAQGTVAADQSNATSVTVRRVLDDLPSQTRQGLQATLDSAVQQTSLESARAEIAGGVDTAGPGGDPVRCRLRRPGRGHDPAACRGVRIPRHAADCPRQRAGDCDSHRHRHCSRRHERGAGAVRDPGHQPHRRGRRAPHAFGRALPIGAAVARHRRWARDTSPLGLGGRPPGLAGRERGRPGRSPGHLPHAGRDALRGPAHRAPEPTCPAHAAGRPGERVRPQPDIPDRRDGRAGQPGLVRRAARHGPLLAGEPGHWRHDEPGRGRRRSSSPRR